MLEKNIDMALIGHNYLSYLLSFDLLLKNQKVLILDDERMRYGSQFGRQITELERVFLKTWGEDNQLGPFINIDRFLERKNLYFTIDHTQVSLGANPFENLVELARRFPEFFHSADGEFNIEFTQELEEDLNSTFISFCHRMGRNACRFSNLQNLSVETFLNHCPAGIKNLFELFKTNVFKMIEVEHDYWNYKTFLYSARSFYQSRMSIHLNELEVFHLFHCILSPFYTLNEAKLIDELSPIFEQRGGQLKRTHVREWKFYKHSPWSLELASFEGIIHPVRVALLGGLPEKLPLKIAPDSKCYKNIVTDVTFSGNTLPLKGIHILAKHNRIGTDQALIILDNSKDESKGIVHQFVLKRKGQKIDFFEKSLTKWLRSDFNTLLSRVVDFNIESVPQFGDEVFVSQSPNFLERSKIHLPKKTQIYDLANPLKRAKLNNVFYFGPYKDIQLGLLTSMVDIKEAQQFL
jgi:hypothetical protein